MESYYLRQIADQTRFLTLGGGGFDASAYVLRYLRGDVADLHDATVHGLYVLDDRLSLGFSRLVAVLGETATAFLKEMASQAHTLTEIRDALYRPGKTRAAEQLMDATELLRRERWSLAQETAARAVENDPNNPGVFWALGMSYCGQEQYRLARSAFEEAAAASDGNDAAIALRAAARAAVRDGRPEIAAATLGRAMQELPRFSADRLPMALERAVMLEFAGNVDAACAELEAILGYATTILPEALEVGVFPAGSALEKHAVALLRQSGGDEVRRRQALDQLAEEVEKLITALEAAGGDGDDATTSDRAVALRRQVRAARLLSDRDRQLEILTRIRDACVA